MHKFDCRLIIYQIRNKWQPVEVTETILTAATHILCTLSMEIKDAPPPLICCQCQSFTTN